MLVPLPLVTPPPARFPSPFELPHPLARVAAQALLAELPSLVDVAALQTGGKMFGVLVVRVGGRFRYLRAFSGMLAGAWTLPGFVPPLFDMAARDAMWPAGQATLREHELALRALVESAPYTSAKAELVAYDQTHAADLAALQERHRVRRAARKLARGTEAAAIFALDQESRGDAAERRRFDAERASGRASIAARVAVGDTERARIETLRADESRDLMRQVHDHYVIANARGERRPLRELFAPNEPAGGAGDCAAPKLLGYAYANGFAPIALAEVWVGAPPATGGRHDGAFYPACRGKCGPILPFMLDGLDHEPIVDPGAGPIAADEPRTLHEDTHIVVVDKPVGLLSIPGRSATHRDCVQVRLRARYPDASGPLVVHRLDLDTSGLLLAARDLATYTLVQAQFARREIAKTYVAIVDGDVVGDAGTIELPLRADIEDRPRQIVDAEHGKSAVTEWRVLSRENGRTRVALAPLTGRTHQLRVHCAHHLGLAAPIVGDRLYGTPTSQTEPRLLLHAERLAFVHPITRSRVELSSPAPF